MWWSTLAFVLLISLDFILHQIVIIFSKVQENDTLCCCYLFFPLFEMLSLALMKEHVVRLSRLHTSNSIKLSTLTVCVCSFVLSRLSHWLYDISSNFYSVIMFLNFFRIGQFMQQCTMHLRLVVSRITIAIKSLYVMSNFWTSKFLSSDSSAVLFHWVFTAEQKQSASNLAFWCWVQTHTECIPDIDIVTHTI